MEGGDQEQKRTCKVCQKSFPCGRSLGGHMRSHMSMNSSSEAVEKLLLLPAPPPTSSQSNRGFLGFGGGGGAGYDLRENPKKTWKLSDYNGTDMSPPKCEKLCRECGKGFRSWRALFGHMRCHRDRSSHTLEQEEGQEEEEGSWSSSTVAAAHKEVLGSQSENKEAAALMVPRRRAKRVGAVAAAASPLFSEIERELEDVAMCLMMLSKDVGFWGGIHSIAESSDKNSVVFEEEVVVAEEEDEGGYISNGYKVAKAKNMQGEEKKEESEMGVIGIGYLRNRLKKLESGVSDDDRVVVGMDDELGKGTDLDQGDSEFGKQTPSKRGRFDAYNAKLGRAYDGSLGKPPHRKNMYECSTCNRTFHSYQALGGHRASHKRIRGYSNTTDGSENSIEAEISIDDAMAVAAAVEEMVDEVAVAVEARCRESPKKVSRHECLICLKVFPSGQALGGHKRSHSIMKTDTGGACHRTIVLQQQQQQLTGTSDLVDLNLPAPADEDSNITDNGQVGFKSWWV